MLIRNKQSTTASPESAQIHVWSLNHERDADAGAGRGLVGIQPMVVVRINAPLCRGGVSCLAYRIAPDDGALTFCRQSALPVADHISTDHHGRFVFVGSL